MRRVEKETINQENSHGKSAWTIFRMKCLYHFGLTVFIVSLLTAYAHGYDMTLAWDPNSEMDIVGYNLYVRVNDSGSYSLVDDLTLNEIDSDDPQFMIIDMENNVTYDFAVTAVNNAGLESHFSNEVSVLNGQAMVPFSSSASGSGGSGGGCFIRVVGFVSPIE